MKDKDSKDQSAQPIPKSAPIPTEHIRTVTRFFADRVLPDLGWDPADIDTERVRTIVTHLDEDVRANLFSTLSEFDSLSELRIGRFATEYNLTAAETRLLKHLTAGGSLTEHAALQNVSRNTVRSQMQMIFEKTGQHRQADVIRMVRDFR